MKKHLQLSLAGLALGFAAAGASAATAQTPLEDAGQVIGVLEAAGYGSVRDIELDDGLWEAEVRGADGRWHDVHVVPATGAVLDPRTGGELLDARTIAARLEAAGFTRVHDLELDEAVWDVEAIDPEGRRVELRVDGFTGAILASSPDR